MRGRKGRKGRKGLKGKKGQRGEISNKGARMMLVEEETHKGKDTQMDMTGTKGIHSTRRDPDRDQQQEEPPQNQRPAEQNAGGQPRNNGVFSRLGGQDRPRAAEDLRDVLNDRRERSGDNI